MRKLFDLRGSIEAAFGIVFDKREKQDDRETWIEPNPTRQGRDMANPHAPVFDASLSSRWKITSRIESAQIKRSSGQSINWDRVESGYRLTLNDAVEFGPGHARYDQREFCPSARVAKSVEHIPYRLMVIGIVGKNEQPLLPNANRMLFPWQ